MSLDQQGNADIAHYPDANKWYVEPYGRVATMADTELLEGGGVIG